MTMHKKATTKTDKRQVSKNLQAALDLAAKGFAVIPLGPDKRPLIKDWQAKATTDPVIINDWFLKWSKAMPGLPTGERNGFTVLDIDKKNGKDGFAELEDIGLDVDSISPTQVQTASGGRHVYFAWEGQGNSAAGLPSGLDVRGQGGFVVAPGAMNGSGLYEQLSGALTKELPSWPAALPIRKRTVDASNSEPTGLPSHVMRKALMACPNDGQAYATRDDWLAVLMALHCETGGGDDGLLLAHEWSQQHASYDPDKTDAAWLSCRSSGLTGWHIIHEAERHGWSDPAVFEIREIERREEAESDFDFMLTPEEEAEIAEMVGVPGSTSFFAPASAWADLPIPSRKWHVEELIPGNTVTMLGGDGGTGKSLLALQLAVATATGTSWIGCDIDQPGKAMVLSAEDDVEELQRRVAAICNAENLPRSSLGNLLVKSTAGEETLMASLDGKTNTLKATAIYKTICASMKRERPTLLVLDTLADLHAGNENDRSHARQFIGLLRHIAIEYQCAVVLLAHPSLTGMSNGSGLSGSTAWNASVRSRLYLRRVIEEGYEQDANARTLETLKANYGPTGGAIELDWLNGVFAADAKKKPDSSAKAERVFLKLLAEHTKQGRKVSPKPSPSYAPAMFAKHPDREGLTKRALATAMETLLQRGVIQACEEGPPSRRSSYLEVNP